MAGISDYFKHLSPSNVNAFISRRSLWYLERIAGFKSVMPPEVHRGAAVEHGVTHCLVQSAPISDGVDLALQDYAELCADLDVNHTAQGREGIPAMVKALVETLKPFGRAVSVQREVRGQLDGLPGVEWKGFTDIEFESCVVDIKTKQKTPSDLPSDWGRQGAFYRVKTGKPVKFVCAIPLKAGPRVVQFTVDETNGPVYLNQLIEAAKSMDRILSLPKEILPDIFAPDTDDWFLNDDLARNAAKSVWKILAA